METTLVAAECAKCGVLIHMTLAYNNHRLGDKASFYCLNGHANEYPGESDADKIARLERIKKMQGDAIDDLYAEQKELRDQVKALKPKKVRKPKTPA